MKKYLLLPLAIAFLALAGCTPNLVVQNAGVEWGPKTVHFTEKNIGNGNAGPHLTYVEINRVGAPNSAKPQSQYSVNVPAIAAGDSWSSPDIPLGSFSPPRGLDILSLTPGTANLVIRADAKNMVKESNESDNVLDINQ